MSAEQTPHLKSLSDVESWLGECQRCPLCTTRNKIVFGSGNPKARLMFVGEGPGADEDNQGLPFVGRAGQLLSKIIEAMGLTRDEVYIANIVKCRPPSNRLPEEEEIEKCLPFLRAQIAQVKPEVIVALGLTATRVLTQTDTPLANLRGRFQSVAWNPQIELMPTYHPAYLLRNPPAKKFVWEDMKLVKEKFKF
ncbi:MAG: uracil-DNA glycosylase [Proteobacteria bacterium]|nr:uracil-DNA glycosylase [Pseudomonadota bacterium]